ncbi:MAG: aminotransferase class V-fold PLP-dependent enzyme [Pirellulaceae bacterium]|nr:aminotransferase class V-fold PLP-dependent enzyme [Pirellulaceae bacterium]
MSQPTRIYLDNAATSWPKPETVYQAVERYLRHCGAPAGRGAYREASEVEREVARCRRLLAELIAAEDPRQIVFTCNATDALNLALHGLLRPGDHVVTSVVEHNSVLRPLRFLEQQQGVQVTRVPCDQRGVVDPAAIERAVRPETRLIALIHASNVTGALQPVEQAGQIARRHGCLLLVDAAQTLGHMPVDVQQLGAHLLAAAGHKGLLGPLGLGFLYMAPGVEQVLQSVRQGGTGTHSDQDRQPDSQPDKFESGNLNVPAILGLAAGLEYLRDRGLERLHEHYQRLTARLLDGLRAIAGVRIHGPADPASQVGVVSVTVAGYDPRELAGLLDSAFAIQVRAGIQCAPLMHEALGTVHHGGTIRFSVGAFTSEREVDQAVEAMAELTAAQVG